jgi:hypothetical protein
MNIQKVVSKEFASQHGLIVVPIRSPRQCPDERACQFTAMAARI